MQGGPAKGTFENFGGSGGGGVRGLGQGAPLVQALHRTARQHRTAVHWGGAAPRGPPAQRIATQVHALGGGLTTRFGRGSYHMLWARALPHALGAGLTRSGRGSCRPPCTCDTPEGSPGHCTCAQAAISTKRRKKIGSAVAYRTRGTFPSERVRHDNASGQATHK